MLSELGQVLDIEGAGKGETTQYLHQRRVELDGLSQELQDKLLLSRRQQKTAKIWNHWQSSEHPQKFVPEGWTKRKHRGYWDENGTFIGSNPRDCQLYLLSLVICNMNHAQALCYFRKNHRECVGGRSGTDIFIPETWKTYIKKNSADNGLKIRDIASYQYADGKETKLERFRVMQAKYFA